MRTVLRWAAIGAGLVLVVAAGLGLAAYRKFSGNIHTDRAAERVLAQHAAQRPPALVPAARNILVMGAGAGAGEGAGSRGRHQGYGEAEAAVLLHLSADRDRAVAVGVPPELRVRVPADCDSSVGAGGYEPFVAAFREGGAACSIRAFEELSGIRVDHYLVVDVRRYQRIEAAVGGRTPDRRGDLVRALAREARGGDGGLVHPARLYGFLDTATSAITADPGLGSLPALYELAGGLRALPPDGLVFRTVPVGAGETPGAEAGRLFAAVRADRPPA
jgi:hypothetical protein